MLARDFAALTEEIEADSNLMHAVMQTSRPALLLGAEDAGGDEGRARLAR